jgi:two-component system sensor histidine kinase YesM
MDCGGYIKVEIGKKDNNIFFDVEDNGSGFDANEMMRYVSVVQSDKGGFAISNINQRLKLHYGEKYGLEFYSEPFVKNSVRVWIPEVRE